MSLRSRSIKKKTPAPCLRGRRAPRTRRIEGLGSSSWSLRIRSAAARGPLLTASERGAANGRTAAMTGLVMAAFDLLQLFDEQLAHGILLSKGTDGEAPGPRTRSFSAVNSSYRDLPRSTPAS